VLVAEQRAPVVLAEAPRHPRFKYFPEADEDRYQSFLGVPILDSSNLRGVLVVQTIEPRQFTSAETGNLAQVAALLGRHWSSILDRDV
jgi:phosphotransferase system enzyme I (PtsP)